MTSLYVESYLLIPDHLSQTVAGNFRPTTGDKHSSFPLVDVARCVGLKDFSPKSQDAVALQQIKERGALPMIDRGDIRQAIDRCSNIWVSLPGAGYGRKSGA